MTELTGQIQRAAEALGVRPPPPVNKSTKPGAAAPSPPPRPNPTRPSPDAGVIYEPGTWPTPDLPLYPVGLCRTLSEGPFTSDAIQAALNELGTNSTLYLAPRTKWIVNEPIILKPHQELATAGYPTQEEEMAELEASETCKPNLLACWRQSGIRVRNIIFEGGREKYGWSGACNVMISMGHYAVNQTVDRCIIRNPRNWSCIQGFEGSHNVRFTNNIIGPAGVGADISSGRWADGISFAGFDGLVAGNKIVDATDGAIVIFGAPGTLVTSNTIVTRTRLCLGAICMGDHQPHDGNYVGTRVLNNTIAVEGSYLKIGIAQGLTCWTSNTGKSINRGGTTMRNLVTSPEGTKGAVGYGYAVADVTQWTCIDNLVDPHVRFEGDISHSLPDPVASPGPFVRDFTPLEKLGRLQPEFVRARISYLIGIKPGHGTVLSWVPGGFQLHKGQRAKVKGVELTIDHALRIIDTTTGHQLWELPLPHVGDAVKLEPDGKLYAIELGGKGMKHDLVPHIPAIHNNGQGEGRETKLILSHLQPHLQIALSPNPFNSTFLRSSYDLRLGQEIRVGHFTIRPYGPQNSYVILFTLSPYAQWVVLVSKVPGAQLGAQFGDGPLCGLVRWGGTGKGRVADDRWNVAWTSDNQPLKEPVADGEKAPKLGLQGDGNLVIYAASGAVWASRTHGKTSPPKFVRYGDGTSEPWISLRNEDNSVVWKTN